MQLRHLPNALTILRLLLVPPLAWLLLAGDYDAALWVAMIAGVTDALDGALARLCGWQSWLGGILDPLADKLMLVTGYLCLWWQGVLPDWLAALVLGRDLVIVVGAIAFHRLIARIEPEPSVVGKLTTFAQLLFLLALLVDLGSRLALGAVLPALAVVAATLTVASGIDYVWRFGLRARSAARQRNSGDAR
jgi:cardiolipin synthase (CMP-forming)